MHPNQTREITGFDTMAEAIAHAELVSEFIKTGEAKGWSKIRTEDRFGSPFQEFIYHGLANGNHRVEYLGREMFMPHRWIYWFRHESSPISASTAIWVLNSEVNDDDPLLAVASLKLPHR